jgi:hypothetical protein
MSAQGGPKRKKQRTLQQKRNGKSNKAPAGMLQPHLANIDRQTVSSRPAVTANDCASNAMVAAGFTTHVPSTPAANTVSTITAGAGEQFNAYRVDEQSSLDSYKQTMEFKLKDDLFRKLKFITNEAMMEFSMDKQSLCQYICCQMNIVGGQQGTFWMAVKDTVKRMIEKQRTNATSGCKRAFQGKNINNGDMRSKTNHN